jgi:hypothetical protein
MLASGRATGIRAISILTSKHLHFLRAAPAEASEEGLWGFGRQNEAVFNRSPTKPFRTGAAAVVKRVFEAASNSFAR